MLGQSKKDILWQTANRYCFYKKGVAACKSAGGKTTRSKPPTHRAMFGRGRFARRSSRAVVRPQNWSNAGIAGMRIFTLTSPVRWKWASVAGQKKYPVEHIGRQGFAAG